MIHPFYNLVGNDSEGRKITDIWSQSDEWWDAQHDFIQWVFPTDKPSHFNNNAPVLKPVDIEALTKDRFALAALRFTFARFLNFLGLEFDDVDVKKASNFEKKKNAFWIEPNHNWLRITRVLECLKLMKLDFEAERFMECLEELHTEGAGSETSFDYWKKAAEPEE